MTISASELVVAIQSVRGRRTALSSTLASLRASDVPTDVAPPLGSHLHVVIQDEPIGHEAKFRTLSRLFSVARDGSDTGLLRPVQNRTWLLRLEDDIIVNRHIFANLSHWGAVNEPDFGAGWLWHSRLLQLRRDNCRRTADGFTYRDTPATVGSLGVLIRIDLLTDAFIEDVTSIGMSEAKGAQDKAISMALHKRGKYVYLHEPPLVEHDLRHRSSQAPDREVVPELHSAMEGFSLDYLRDGA